MGKRQCELEGCTKWVQAGGTPHCKAHGGGKRCQQEGCFKSAMAGRPLRCIAHGGGRRCQHEGCTKSVARLAGSKYCSACAADVESAEEERAEARGGEASTAQWDQMVSEMGAGRLSGGDEFAACGEVLCSATKAKERKKKAICLPRGIPAPPPPPPPRRRPPVPRPVLRPQPPPAAARSSARRAPPTAVETVVSVETVIVEKKKDDECTVCGDRGGFLISCSFCVRSFHFECLDKETLLSLTAEPSGDTSWACPRKVCKVPSLRNPVTVSVRLGVRVA